jgi:hypothetical protein
LTATGLDANFWPTPDAGRDRFVLICGLIAQERVSINKAVDDLSPIEKDHLFTVLEENLDYPANLEESVRKKAVKAAISQIGTLQRRFKAHLRKKYASEEETLSYGPPWAHCLGGYQDRLLSGPLDYSACATRHLMVWGARTTVEKYMDRKLYMSCTM